MASCGDPLLKSYHPTKERAGDKSFPLMQLPDFWRMIPGRFPGLIKILKDKSPCYFGASQLVPNVQHLLVKGHMGEHMSPGKAFPPSAFCQTPFLECCFSSCCAGINCALCRGFARCLPAVRTQGFMFAETSLDISSQFKLELLMIMLWA